jgi:hypothetical protein
MQKTVFAITPPFTQLNTPYPATAYIKGFLNTKNISCFHADLGIEVILALFSKSGLEELFRTIEVPPAPRGGAFSSDLESKAPPLGAGGASRMLALQDDYIQTIDSVISFLQGKNPTLSHVICQESFLPEGSRFAQLEEDLDWAFGLMGTQDKAKHLATLYLEDLSDLICQ